VRQRLIFSGSVEALMKVVALNPISPEATKALVPLRMGAGFKMEPAYPADDWAKAVKIIGADLHPNEQPDEQHRLVGRATVLQFADSLMGKALFAARLLCRPHRDRRRLHAGLGRPG
jgi:uncharacterized protein (TIGR02265 family)